MKKKKQPNKLQQKQRGEKLVGGFITILKFLYTEISIKFLYKYLSIFYIFYKNFYIQKYRKLDE